MTLSDFVCFAFVKLFFCLFFVRLILGLFVLLIILPAWLFPLRLFCCFIFVTPPLFPFLYSSVRSRFFFFCFFARFPACSFCHLFAFILLVIHSFFDCLFLYSLPYAPHHFAGASSITSHPQDATATEGDNVTITCDAQDQTNVTWFKNEAEINLTNPRFSESRVNQTSSLHITNVNRTDEGLYKCRATRNGSDSTFSNTSSLTVNCKCHDRYIDQINGYLALTVPFYFGFPSDAGKVLSPPTDQTKIEGENVTLQCEVFLGELSANVTWYKDGSMVSTESNGSRFSTRDQSGIFSLTITGLNRTDEGNYSCQVNNSVGTVSSAAALLTVNCKNSRVIFVAVELGLELAFVPIS